MQYFQRSFCCFSLKKSKHWCATAWLNPTDVAVSVFCDNLSFPLSAVLARSNLCPRRSTLTNCCGCRSYVRLFLSGKSKCRPCLQYCDKRFKRSIDNYNRTCERFIGKLSTVVEWKKVCNSCGTISKIQADKRMKGYVVNKWLVDVP